MTLGSIGLIIDMIGVSILFFVVNDVVDQIEKLDLKEETLRRRTNCIKKILLYCGFVLILIGFILQLLANETKSKPNTVPHNNNSTESIIKSNTLKQYHQFCKNNWSTNKWTEWQILILIDSL